LGEPTLDQRYAEVRQRAQDAISRAGRRDSVYLVAVTKNAEPDDIRRLIELGHRDFGENRVQQLVQRAAVIQEWFERIKMLPETVTAAERAEEAKRVGLGGAGHSIDVDQPVRWHMIGHLQRNKARKVVEYSRLVHSVDSLRLAEELHALGHRRDKAIDVLIQVNVSGEEQKYGCPAPAAEALAEQIETMVHVQCRGLMTMAPDTDNPENARGTFERCRELFEEMQLKGFGDGRFNLLSMGMSGDFEIAIEEGANLVRVGTAIFGHRAETPEESHASA